MRRNDLTERWLLLRLARRAAALALEEQRVLGAISDPLDSSILLYTDDPTTAGVFATNPDLADICRTSAIEGVVVSMAQGFPPDAHEAERDDLEMPRVAAMYFPAPGDKCPRCRKFTRAESDELCGRCARVAG